MSVGAPATAGARPRSLQGPSDAGGVSTLHGARGKTSETWSSERASEPAHRPFFVLIAWLTHVASLWSLTLILC